MTILLKKVYILSLVHAWTVHIHVNMYTCISPLSKSFLIIVNVALIVPFYENSNHEILFPRQIFRRTRLFACLSIASVTVAASITKVQWYLRIA